MAGSRNAAFTWRKIIGTVQAGAKELQNWSSEMRIGVLDALGTSKDLIKKGIHFHFEKLGNLELTLKPMAGGKMGLGFISGNRKLAKDAVKLFNRAMENQ